MTDPTIHRPTHARVLIAGGGVAALETLLALRALAPDRTDVTLLAPELKFVNRSMSVDGPFKPQRVRGLRLQDTAAELGAQWHRGALDRVEHGENRVVTKDGARLSYDMLVVALGAHTDHEWHSKQALTYRDGRDSSTYRLLLHHLREGRFRRLAFVKPAGASWLLPLYDLALATAAECLAHRRPEIELSFVTPEEEPLGVFGNRASTAVRQLLQDRGIALYTASYAQQRHHDWLEISPGDRRLEVDRVVITPQLVGPRLRGLPCDRDGFVPTDTHGRVHERPGIFAAGDATTFPVKHGAVATDQADAVAETIAASLGVDIDAQPFRPVLRGVLLTGGPPRYLRSDISGGAGDDSTISSQPLWWPPNKLAGRYLAPFLSTRVGDAADVVPQDRRDAPMDVELDPGVSPERPVLADLSARGPG